MGESYKTELAALADAIPHHWQHTAALVESYLSAGASCQHKPDIVKLALETNRNAMRSSIVLKDSPHIISLPSKIECKPKTPRGASSQSVVKSESVLLQNVLS